nr:hypothetical protein [Tanacetum cinerariifolium]
MVFHLVYDVRASGVELICEMEFVRYDPNPNSFDCPPDSYHPPHPTYETYSGDTCGNDSQFGYDCPPQFSLNYEPEPGYTQNYNSCPHDSPSFPQQYPCCDDCGVTHEPYQCQPMNEHYYHEQNSCYNSNSFSFDDCQPPQYTVNHPIFNTHHDYLDSQKELSTTITKLKEQMTSLTSFCEIACQIVQKKHEEKWIEEKQAAKAQNRKLPSLHNEDVSKKIFSNPLFEEEIISIRIDQHHFNAEFDLVESMLNRDSSVISSSSKINSLLDEFVGEITLLKSIPPGIDKADCHPKNEIRFSERLLYDNSSPRPPEEFVFENSNAEIESFSPSPIPIEDSDSHMEEINLSFNPDDPMPPSIEDDDNHSEGDNLFLERLLHNDPIPLRDTFDFSNAVIVFFPSLPIR